VKRPTREHRRQPDDDASGEGAAGHAGTVKGDKPPDLTEATIRAHLEAGHRAAASTELLTAYGPEIRRYLRGLLGDESQATDAFGSFGERLWAGLPAFRGDCSARAWAFRLAWSAAADLRKDAWHQRVRRLETDEGAALPGPPKTSTAERVERLRSSLDELRADLPLEEQSLLQLRLDRKLSWQECAQVMSEEGGEPLRPDALMKRFERIKAKLKALAASRVE
jgi:RNA polymerase sigma-70 factor (ECF subfamily)